MRIEYFLFGKRHRDDGPAIITDDNHYWYLDGKLLVIGNMPDGWENSGYWKYVVKEHPISSGFQNLGRQVMAFDNSPEIEKFKPYPYRICNKCGRKDFEGWGPSTCCPNVGKGCDGVLR